MVFLLCGFSGGSQGMNVEQNISCTLGTDRASPQCELSGGSQGLRREAFSAFHTLIGFLSFTDFLVIKK